MQPVRRLQIRPIGQPYHSPKLHPGPCNSVGIRPRTDRQTHTQTRVTTIHFASSTTHAKCNNNAVKRCRRSLKVRSLQSHLPLRPTCCDIIQAAADRFTLRVALLPVRTTQTLTPPVSNVSGTSTCGQGTTSTSPSMNHSESKTPPAARTITSKSVFTARCYTSALYAVSVRLSVCNVRAL